MNEKKNEVDVVNIKEELKNSYLDYAMSVIIGRALPDVRDGLKPVHRRVLYAMSVLGNNWNKPYKKSARIVGDVIGKYHPHGDSAVYDTIVRLAQSFSMRYILIDGQGNFGSIDGDSAAAMRYTEIRMSKIAHELLCDLDKKTIKFVQNYDGTEKIPEVMPTKIPNLLINGSSGIAVGMATNIPPHNISEVINACLAILEDKKITVKDLLKYIPGPDFPTSAIINGRQGILEAYKTGRGKIYIRAKTKIENNKNGMKTIIINEIPYQVNKSRLIEKIAYLIKNKRIEGISSIRDESDKDGIRIVIDLKKNVLAEVVLNNLYTLTQLEISFGINMVALCDSKPKLLNLKEILSYFIDHRKKIVFQRTFYELHKARKRVHILEGLVIALRNIDLIINKIRNSSRLNEVKLSLRSLCFDLENFSFFSKNSKNIFFLENLIKKKVKGKKNSYYFTDQQIQEILELRLQKLTNLEYNKIFDEHKELSKKIFKLLSILNSSSELINVIKKELIEIKEKYSDIRRTEIINNVSDINIEDLINKEEIIIVLSCYGYIKYCSLSKYEAQNRGGKGRSIISVKKGDKVKSLLISNTHDIILCFSNYGRLYWIKTFKLSLCNKGDRGKPIVNFLSLKKNERIVSIFSIREFNDFNYLLMITSHGIVKKTPLKLFNLTRISGIIAIRLNPGDELVSMHLTTGKNEVILFSFFGRAVRFLEKYVRPMGRASFGVRGIKLKNGDRVVSSIIIQGNGDILTITENGYGKRTNQNEYPIKSRATQGVLAIKTNKKNGNLIGAIQIKNLDNYLVITKYGTILRGRVSDIRSVRRNSQGVVLIRINSYEKAVSVCRCLEKF